MDFRGWNSAASASALTKSGVCNATGTGNGEGRDGGEHQALVGITATARLVPGGASSEAICFAAAGAHARKGGGLGLGRAVTQGRMSVRC